MTSVTNEMKLRCLVAHGALVFQGGAWVPLSQIKTNQRRTPTNLLNAARKAGITVKCACGCGVWATYAEINFDHAQARVNGGATAISWLQPLRYDPCHKAKTRKDLKLRDKMKRIREKFFGTRLPKRQWPSRTLSSRPFQLYAIQGGRA